jgi:hypothetical protein
MKRAAILLFATSAALFADGWSDLRRSCFTRSSLWPPNYWLAECVQELFTTDPVAVTLGTVAPGAGIVAYGLGISHPLRMGQTEFLPGGEFVRSTDGSFLLRNSITIGLPTRALTDLAQDAARYGTYQHRISQESRLLDAKSSLTLSVSRMEAKEQDFYGLGDHTAFSAHPPSYGLRLNDAGLGWNNPLFVWSSLGVNADFLQPRVGLSSNSAAPQVRDQFNNSTAPGLVGYTDFASFQPYLQVQLPAHRSTYIAMDLGYAFYHSIDDGNQYSFRRLSADARFARPLVFPAKRRRLFNSVSDPSKKVSRASKTAVESILDAICWNQRGADYCSIGDLSVYTRVDCAFTGANSSVPFYFQSTLGGTDFQGLDTLRGYADYRFRAPNRMLGQVEYRHPLWGPIGLVGFYEWRSTARISRSIISVTIGEWDFTRELAGAK